jgi:hypothetical protein
MDAAMIPGLSDFAPKAKRVIYLFQNGAPSQIESFDYKPKLKEMVGQELPDSVRGAQRLTGMTANQASFPLVGSFADFKQYGQSGAWVSDLFPYTSRIVDDLCIVRSMHTEAINHDPALTFFQTGSQQGNRPSMGAWLSYGLGSENKNLPAFTVLLSRGIGNGQGVYSKLWTNGFLDSVHQGVQFSSGEDPVLYLKDSKGLSREERRVMLDNIAELNHLSYEKFGDPEISAKIKQYEMAYRMQTTVPEIMDLSKEPDSVIKLYGPDCLVPGTYAANCLMARKLSESGVRFVQLYHQGWDQHDNLPYEISHQAKDTDQASAALVTDLKQRGLLDETLVIWGGEFGRTSYSQGKLTAESYGRDHHPRCLSIWMAGGGCKAGHSIGSTDDRGMEAIEEVHHVRDLHVTLLRLLGLDDNKLTFYHGGRFKQLSQIGGQVIDKLIA